MSAMERADTDEKIVSWTRRGIVRKDQEIEDAVQDLAVEKRERDQINDRIDALNERIRSLQLARRNYAEFLQGMGLGVYEGPTDDADLQRLRDKLADITVEDGEDDE